MNRDWTFWEICLWGSLNGISISRRSFYGNGDFCLSGTIRLLSKLTVKRTRSQRASVLVDLIEVVQVDTVSIELLLFLTYSTVVLCVDIILFWSCDLTLDAKPG
jgi:hypothetical protein